MRVIPSIDLLGGQIVRLRQGDYDQVTRYAGDPAALARSWREHVDTMHVVDLDGARSGQQGQHAIVVEIVRAFGRGVQLGGGIRSFEALERVLDLGVERAVLGTAAVRDPEFCERACRAYPGQIVIAVDARAGLVSTDGWREASQVRAVDLVRQFAGFGIAAVLYTDIERDGTEVGPNVAATAELAQAGGVPVIASGGVGSLDHLRALARATPSIAGAIVGRALHEQRFTLAEAAAAAQFEA
jgi:phosphoribosylformimino-5-aminoimidazole carboxamide ribotide isomerase